jgi:hypothetical protein
MEKVTLKKDGEVLVMDDVDYVVAGYIKHGWRVSEPKAAAPKAAAPAPAPVKAPRPKKA